MRMPKCPGIPERAGVEVIAEHQFAARAADHLTAYEHGRRRPENRTAQSRAAALAGFGLDSLIEIFASSIVIWQIKGIDRNREARALRLIGGAFFLLAV